MSTNDGWPDGYIHNNHVYTRASLLADAGCTCRGEVHDECRPCDDCDQAPALNDVVDDPESGGTIWFCDDCWEERVEAEDQREREQRELDIMETYLRNE